MRAILKSIGVLALAVCGLGLTGCCNGNNCWDAWDPYDRNRCDLVEGREWRDCNPSCGPCN